MDRQQFDGGHPELLQVLDRDRVRHARIRAAQLLRDLRMPLGKPLDVRFVKDRLVPRSVWTAIGTPVEERVDHDSLRRVRRTVEFVARVLRLGEVVGKDRLIPLPHAVDGLGVGVQHQLRRIAPLPLLGRPRTVDAKAVALPRLHVGQVAVPTERGRLRKVHLALGAGIIEETQLHPRRDFRKHRKVRPHAVEGGAEWVGLSWPDLHQNSITPSSSVSALFKPRAGV
jgi:hypothetical protein